MDFRFTLENDEIIQAYLLLTNRDIPRPDCIHEIQNNRLKVFLNTRFTRLNSNPKFCQEAANPTSRSFKLSRDKRRFLVKVKVSERLKALNGQLMDLAMEVEVQTNYARQVYFLEKYQVGDTRTIPVVGPNSVVSHGPSCLL